MGAGGIALGLFAWFLPYRWNPFRFKKLVASMLSESANEKVPKVIGVILVLLGIALLIATLTVGKFQ